MTMNVGFSHPIAEQPATPQTRERTSDGQPENLVGRFWLFGSGFKQPKANPHPNPLPEGEGTDLIWLNDSGHP